jgi:hypothetical protein
MIKTTLKLATTFQRILFTLVLLLACVGLAVLAVLGNRAYQATAEGVKSIGSQIAEELPGIAERFSNERITHTFISGIPEVSSNRGDILEVAIARSDEYFKRSDTRTVLWDSLNLGTTVAEIKVPVTYRYHIRLSDTWHLAERDNICYVMAPAIRASQPPAIHTDNLAALERSLTPELEKRAVDPRHLKLVREACRVSVAEFVKHWLLRENHWSEDRFTAIQVVFPDEVSLFQGHSVEQPPTEPTLRL